MSRLLLSALVLTSCAAEVPPRADAGDPRVLPVGATAALDGSFSEGDGLTYAWTVAPEGATIRDADSPFASFNSEAPGFYTLTLEVCDEAGRCDTAETWARVDEAPGSASRISSWGIDEFAGSESGAGAIDGLSFSKSICDECFATASKTSSEWESFCRTLEKNGATKKQMAVCWGASHETTDKRQNACRYYGCKG